jgi:NADP-dependent 3-hydroxy acid dehydrogenase YdfG
MTQKKIFISGGSKGIGLAIAKRFYEEGWLVIICARGEKGLQQAKEIMPEIHTYTCDMSDKKEVKELGKELTQTFGALDIVVNNAGVFQPGAIHEENEEAYELMMRTNMDSTYYMTRALLPPMLQRKSGAIVNMASIASISAYPNGGSYSISKYAMLGFSRNLRQELMPKGIRVVTVMPGATFTASWAGVDVDPERLMPAEDIAELVWTSMALSKRSVVEEIIVRPQLGDL